MLLLNCYSSIVLCLLIPSTFAAKKKTVRRPILPEERTPFQPLKDPAGRFLGFYEDGDKVPSKFHYYYSAWEEDAHRDKVHRLNNRHIGALYKSDDFDNPMTEAEFQLSNSVLMVVYIIAIILTWLPYALSVCVRAISRCWRLRRERREREAEEELLRQIPDRLRSQKSLGPTRSHSGSRRGPRRYRHQLNFAEDDEELARMQEKHAREQDSFRDGPEDDPKPNNKVKFSVVKCKMETKSSLESISISGIRDSIKKLFGLKSNRVQPMDADAGDKCDPYVDEPLSEESDDGESVEKAKHEFKIQIEPVTVTSSTWVESENEADIDSSSSSSNESEDEGSMWTYWKKLRERSKKKPEYQEDYSKHFTNSLW